MKLLELIVILFILFIFALIALPNWLNYHPPANQARTNRDLKMISNALEMFYLDNKSYPPMDNVHTQTQYADLGPDDFIIDNTFLFRISNGNLKQFLTTPVAYISLFPQDHFRNYIDPKGYGYGSKGYGYGSNGSSYYILTSWGPDKTDGIKGVVGGELDERQYTGAQFSDRDRAGLRGSNFILSDYRFDPSNGINSSGDIIMIGP